MTKSLFNISTSRVATSVGPVELPIFYHDVHLLQAFTLVDFERAQPFLYDTGFRAVPFFGRYALAGVAAFDYIDTSVGPYQEVALCVAVYPPGYPDSTLPVVDLFRNPKLRTMGFYIIELPVSTAIARAAGREIWGYPKFVTEIPFEMTSKGIEMRVLDPNDGSEILHMGGNFGPGIPTPGLDLMTWSNNQDKIMRTVIDVDAKFTTTVANSVTINVGPSQHRMANNFRALGLDGARPSLMMWSKQFKSRLNGPASVGRHITPPLPYADQPPVSEAI